MIYHIQNDGCLWSYLMFYIRVCDIESDTWKMKCDFKEKWVWMNGKLVVDYIFNGNYIYFLKYCGAHNVNIIEEQLVVIFFLFVS